MNTKTLLSLTKLGNIKIGKVENGNAIAMETILVTKATKETEENFKVFPGFSEEGVNKLDVTLPFDDPELNFEVNYVSFIKVEDIEYLAKATNIGEPIVLHPLNPEDFDKGSFKMGTLTDELVEKLDFNYTGFLKVQLPGISSFGEVFYFKTKSLNTINTIKNQLKITSTLLGGLANYPLVLKPIKKDITDSEGQSRSITYLSIGMDMDKIREYKKENEDLDDDLFYGDLDEIYRESRNIDFDELKEVSGDNVVVLGGNYEEIVSITSEKDEFINIMKEHDVEPEFFEMILEVATKNTITTLSRYFKYLKNKPTGSRTYKSNFKKAINSKMPIYTMIAEMDA